MKNKQTTITPAIEVWNIDLREHSPQAVAYHDRLSPEEKRRAQKFIKQEDANRYALCRGLLRQILSDHLDQPAETLRFSQNENGKPFLADGGPAFNISHSRDRLLIAVSPDRDVGVDIEFRRSDVSMAAISKRWFSEEEQAFFQGSETPLTAFFDIWAKKEAYVKALGTGIYQELNAFTVPLESPSTFPKLGKSGEWVFQALEIDPAYAAAIVYKKPAELVHLRTLPSTT